MIYFGRKPFNTSNNTKISLKGLPYTKVTSHLQAIIQKLESTSGLLKPNAIHKH